MPTQNYMYNIHGNGTFKEVFFFKGMSKLLGESVWNGSQKHPYLTIIYSRKYLEILGCRLTKCFLIH
jgi:hypothetical protein